MHKPPRIFTRKSVIAFLFLSHLIYAVILGLFYDVIRASNLQTFRDSQVQPAIQVISSEGLTPPVVNRLEAYFNLKISHLTLHDERSFVPDKLDPTYSSLSQDQLKTVQDNFISSNQSQSFWQTGKDYYYLWSIKDRLNNNDGQDWLVFVASNRSAVKPILSLGFYLYLGFGLVITLIYFVYQKLIQIPLSRIKQDLIEILPTEDRLTTSEGLFDQVTFQIKGLKDYLQAQANSLSTSAYQQSILINHLILGIVVIDNKGNITLTNTAAQQLLSLNPGHQHKHYAALIKSYPINAMIHEVRKNYQAKDQEVELWVPDARIVHVNVIPYAPAKNSQEVLVLLYDLTDIRRLETIRSEFAANASHELRTPITAIKGFAETLQNGALENPQVAKQFVDIIALESLRLEKIIKDILDLSQIEKQESALQLEPVALKDHLHILTEPLKRRLLDKQMTLVIECPSDLTLETDPRRLDHILLNLIHNAINYSDPNKTITLLVEDRSRIVRISVIDQGYGIAIEDQDRIFERFYRVDKARSRQTGGTGLGLSIVRHLVKSLNGTISLNSKLGQGATFTIHLPKNP
ncbi:TPA: two-component system histidine kinase PnpS [Streptococcus suis]